MIKAFFKDLDKQWKPMGNEPYELNIIGCAALFLQSSYTRTTKDSDVLEVKSLLPKISEQLLILAGPGRKLAKKHRVYIDIVNSAIPFLPVEPIFHNAQVINHELKNLIIKYLNVTDVVVSKLKRFSALDVNDIRNVCDLGMIDPETLKQRFLSAVDAFQMDSRAQDIMKYIDNLHVVERDFLLVEESEIKLPQWMYSM